MQDVPLSGNARKSLEKLPRAIEVYQLALRGGVEWQLTWETQPGRGADKLLLHDEFVGTRGLIFQSTTQGHENELTSE